MNKNLKTHPAEGYNAVIQWQFTLPPASPAKLALGRCQLPAMRTVSFYFYPAGGELETDRPVLSRVIDLGSTSAVGIFDLLDAGDVIDIPVAAEEDELRFAPEGEAGGVAPRRAVVRSHDDIAIERFFRQQILESWGLQIAGEQDSPPGVLDQQHDAVGVVGAKNPLGRRMERLEPRASGSTELVSRREVSQRDAAFVDGRFEFDECRLRGEVIEHNRRNIDDADGKSLQKPWQGTEMVRVRVRNHDGIQVRDASGPEDGRNGPDRSHGRAEAARIVEERLAIWKLDEGGRAVAHGNERAAQRRLTVGTGQRLAIRIW